MRLPQIHSTLTQEPLIILPTFHASLIKLFDDHRSEDRIKREGEDICGGEVEMEQAQMIDRIMHIPISGPIGRGLGRFEKGAGCVDVADIEAEIENAESDPSCRGIIFHCDSPGGMYSGTPELGDRIRQCELTTASFIPGMACSGMYWLASSCDYVCATKSADIGNVGVYCYLLDQSARYAALGVKPVLVTSGEYKGMGAPGIPLTKAQLGHLQDRVDEMAQTFYQHVKSCRPDVELPDMAGQAWKGPSALAKGFIDMLVPDLDAVVALF